MLRVVSMTTFVFNGRQLMMRRDLQFKGGCLAKESICCSSEIIAIQAVNSEQWILNFSQVNGFIVLLGNLLTTSDSFLCK